MQKKIIALAVAGLVSGAAFAQSNVVIYGVADAGYVYNSDSYNDAAKSISKIYSGGQSGSRLGFKGTEDLGNGLSANFRLEMGIDIDNGSSAQGGRAFGRWSTVGLSSKNWGEVQIGRRDSFTDELLGGFDATGRNTVAQASPIMTQNFSRYSNMVAYLSPVWSGLQFKAGVSTQADGQENERVTTSNNRIATAAVNYINGPLKVGAVYERNKVQSTNVASALDAGSLWTVAAGYNFGVVALSAEYGHINYSDDVGTIEKRKQWTVGAMVPFGSRDRLALQYARGKNEMRTISDEKANMWGVSYFHDLSKRTNIYAAYGSISQDEDNTVLYGLDGQGTYQKAIQVGLRHQF